MQIKKTIGTLGVALAMGTAMLACSPQIAGTSLQEKVAPSGSTWYCQVQGTRDNNAYLGIQIPYIVYFADNHRSALNQFERQMGFAGECFANNPY